MGRRIEIELTAKRDDGSWTWRAPGARQPRGVVEGELIPDDATPGVVLKAEADFDLDGIFVTSIIGARTAERGGRTGERIELIGSKMDSSKVSVSLASKDGRRRGGGLFDDRPPRKRGPGGRADQRDTGRRPEAERPADGDGERKRRPDRTGSEGRTRRTGREDAQGREPAKRQDSAGGDHRHGGPARPGRPGTRAPADRSGRPRGLQPSTEHRNAALATLRPEQLPVAEQLLRGGIPALRKAIDEQNDRARSEGRAEVDPGPLLTMADDLLPKMNLASWKDRAVAARAADRDCPLRELRAVVAAASTVNLDDDARDLQATLKKSLETRVTALRESWLGRIGKALDDGRVVDALGTATRAPEPSMRLPAELAVRLSDAAGAALSSDVGDEGWLRTLEAVVASPVRRTVKPAGLPTGDSDEVRNAARKAAGSVPQLARLLGLPIPPPPGPRRPQRPVGPARRAATA